MIDCQKIGIFALVLAVALVFATYQAWDVAPISIEIAGSGLSIVAIGVGLFLLKANRTNPSAGEILVTGSLWAGVFIALGMIVVPMIQQSMVH